MKTIRQNCFETNSSSTHSLTLHAPSSVARPSTTFLANEEGFIDVSLTTDPSECESSMPDKLSFLLSYAYIVGDQSKFDQVKNVVETFTKIPIRAKINRWDYKERKNISETDVQTVCQEMAEIRATIEDKNEADKKVGKKCNSFDYFVGDYGHSSMEDFMSEASKIFASDEMVLTFIFSNSGGFTSETYYDG